MEVDEADLFICGEMFPLFLFSAINKESQIGVTERHNYLQRKAQCRSWKSIPE